MASGVDFQIQETELSHWFALFFFALVQLSVAKLLEAFAETIYRGGYHTYLLHKVVQILHCSLQFHQLKLYLGRE